MDIRKIKTKIASLEAKLENNQKQIDVLSAEQNELKTKLNELNKLQKRAEELEELWDKLNDQPQKKKKKKEANEETIEEIDTERVNIF